jgi:hypothetical protein
MMPSHNQLEKGGGGRRTHPLAPAALSGSLFSPPPPPPFRSTGLFALSHQALVEFVLTGARELVDEARAKALVEEVGGWERVYIRTCV